MKIAQITDIHNRDTSAKNPNADSIRNLRIILDDIKIRDIKQVVLTGDYGTHNRFPDIIDEIENRDFVYDFILGNHDILTNYKTQLKIQNRIKNNELFYKEQIENNILLFMDTSSEYLSKEQVTYIENAASENTPDRIILFMHHPLLDCGNTGLDIYAPLRNRDEVVNKLLSFKNEIVFFSGHYHFNEYIERANIKQFVTMSALYQFRNDTKNIEIESYDFGYRIIDIGDEIKSEIVRFEGDNI